MNAIDIANLSYRYGRHLTLDGISLQVAEGEFLGLVGPNGGGKSTLLKLILGLLEPQQGNIQIFGHSPKAARMKVGYVPQYPGFRRDFPITVEEMVLMGRAGHTPLWGRYRRVDRQRVEQALGETEISDLKKRAINELSGGQLQRAMVARALAGEPNLLLLDEPTANIDQRMETEIFDLLAQLNKRMTIIVVSHDIGFISGYVQKVACLSGTLVCHQAEDISGEMIQSLYGAHVHALVHDHDHNH